MGRRTLRDVLWWLGGVPRFLVFLVDAAANAARLSSPTGLRADVAAYLKVLEPAAAASLVSCVAARLWDSRLTTSEVLDAAFSFAVMELPVPRTFVLMGSAASETAVTVQRAQADSLLYWRAARGADTGVIKLPPLVLHWRKQRLAHSQCLYPVQYFVPFMSPRDNESVVATVLMHKARAFAALGHTTVPLSRFGIPVHATLIPDVSVRLPSCFDVVRTDDNVTEDNFQALVELVRSSSSPATTAVAFVSAATAPFGDSFLILPDFA